ncbi:MAG: NUDIX hydrolase [Gemmatimonadota bacterium]|jgi:ADP-ribose pyrophosphatase
MNDSPERAGGTREFDPGHLESRLIHDGRVVHLSVDRVRFPDGSEGELELIRHRGASAVVPFLGDPAESDPTLVLIYQYRYAAGGFVYEIPAGIPTDGESWEECARRELEEETGYIADALTHLTSIFTTPGFTNEEVHLFQAHGLKRGSVSRDKDEFMEVKEFPFSKVLQMVGEGAIRDAKSLTGILLADRLRRDRGRGE